MVCDRCKMVVRDELKRLGLNPVVVQLGEVELDQPLSDEVKLRLATQLTVLGFELLDDKKKRLTEMMKAKLVELIQYKNGELKTNLSDYLSSQLGHDYSYLSKLFSDEMGVTIEKYFIALKIEKVKEWLAYGELSLSEIAYRMNYSSVAHLSGQFKKVMGVTPTQFKHKASRRSLDRIS